MKEGILFILEPRDREKEEELLELAERILENVNHSNLPAPIPYFIKVFDNKPYIIKDITELEPTKVNSKFSEFIINMLKQSRGTGIYHHRPIWIQMDAYHTTFTSRNPTFLQPMDEEKFKQKVKELKEKLEKLKRQIE